MWHLHSSFMVLPCAIKFNLHVAWDNFQSWNSSQNWKGFARNIRGGTNDSTLFGFHTPPPSFHFNQHFLWSRLHSPKSCRGENGKLFSSLLIWREVATPDVVRRYKKFGSTSRKVEDIGGKTTEFGYRKEARIIRRLEKPRVREVGILLYGTFSFNNQSWKTTVLLPCCSISPHLPQSNLSLAPCSSTRIADLGIFCR